MNPAPAFANRIEKRIELRAPVSRVWRAITDHHQFSQWFGVKMDDPFAAGQPSTGQITLRGYEHLKFQIDVQKIEPERYFSFNWHPYAIDPKIDYSHETPTLVEFTFEKIPTGTLLTVAESGFDKIPADRQLEAFRKNDNGWAQQMQNIEKFLAENS